MLRRLTSVRDCCRHFKRVRGFHTDVFYSVGGVLDKVSSVELSVKRNRVDHVVRHCSSLCGGWLCSADVQPTVDLERESSRSGACTGVSECVGARKSDT
jgi:hypothetical protein